MPPSKSFPFQTSKTNLSDSTLRAYKTKMNRLYKEGFQTVEDLVQRPEELVKTISKIVSPVKGEVDGTTDTVLTDKEEEQKRREGRIYFSAVFAVLHGHKYLEDQNNKLRVAYHTFTSTAPKPEGWKGFDEFVATK